MIINSLVSNDEYFFVIEWYDRWDQMKLKTNF